MISRCASVNISLSLRSLGRSRRNGTSCVNTQRYSVDAEGFFKPYRTASRRVGSGGARTGFYLIVLAMNLATKMSRRRTKKGEDYNVDIERQIAMLRLRLNVRMNLTTL